MRYALNTVAINDSARLYGRSTAILVDIGATGYSAKQKYAQSAAVLVDVSSTGVARLAKRGSGTAPVVVGAAGKGVVGLKGAAMPASVSLGARHGIPSPMPHAPVNSPAHPSRVIMVASDQRIVVVPTPAHGI